MKGEDLTEVINEVLDKGECCPSQYMGIIILHYKAGEREIPSNNWRPITLLNVDYKVIDWVLAARLKKILSYIVDEDQKGYVDKGNITDAIMLNEDVIFHCEKKWQTRHNIICWSVQGFWQSGVEVDEISIKKV